MRIVCITNQNITTNHHLGVIGISLIKEKLYIYLITNNHLWVINVHVNT